MSADGLLLRFGIPSLDFLLGAKPDVSGARSWDEDCGIWVPSEMTTSISLIGPDGTGKSVLGLHLASRYLCDTNFKARVMYVSTDLNYRRAYQVWDSFALGHPHERNPVFSGHGAERERAKISDGKESKETIELKWYFPGEDTQRRNAPDPQASPIVDLLTGHTDLGRVAFIDLAEYTAGDDWGFLNRVLAALESPGSGIKHLAIIDAIEGFQAFSGDSDAFGEKRSRRSRISQIMRVAAAKCHILFVTEEPKEGEHTPEEFVTDAVIRLRSRRIRDYARRTVEIEKVRSQAQIRGEHSYTIRKGAGSKTGDHQENDDDPRVRHPGRDASDSRTQAYVAVFPSVHCLSRESMLAPSNGSSAGLNEMDRAGFGIPYLDELLVPSASGNSPGLPFGKVTALIGDARTQKAKLGRCFLVEEFKPYFETLFRLYRSCGFKEPDYGKLSECERRVGGIVLITSLDWTRERLIDLFLRWFSQKLPKGTKIGERIRNFLSSRITCRRLEVHDIPNSVLLHLIAQTMDANQKRQSQAGVEDPRLRVLIEDFSTWREIYPDIRNETLFLPALLSQLRRSKAASLLIDTHPGRPDTELTDPFDIELRAMVDYQLYTWRVHYFGENRTAIAAIPPMSGSGLPASDSGAVIRELKWTPEHEPPEVDTHFEMYTGLEGPGGPQPVAVEVRLFDETFAFEDYRKLENAVLDKLFRPAREKEIVVGEDRSKYEAFHDVAVFQQETRLEYTLVLAVDEFWRRWTRAFRDQKAYLKEECDQNVDPAGRFQVRYRTGWQLETPANSSGSLIRWQDFHVPGPEPLRLRDPNQWTGSGPDRVPFMWDFGFLLCRGNTWKKHEEAAVHNFATDKDTPIGDIWAGMVHCPFPASELDPNPESHEPRQRPSWRNFLGACLEIAQGEGVTTIPFDLDTSLGETLACLVLEIWASEILISVDGARAKGEARQDPFDWADQQSLPFMKLVKDFSFELYKAFLLLIDVLPLERIVDIRSPFSDQHRPIENGTIAHRHWYKTACAWEKEIDIDDTFLKEIQAVGLPGSFSVRGDWSLAVPGNSRSFRLADQVIDHLCSRRANYTRMHMGLGLPVRHVPQKESDRDSMHTALLSRTRDGRPGYVTYGSLCSLGQTEANQYFRWLWRSTLKDYDLHGRQWRRWIHRVLLAWGELIDKRTKKGKWDKRQGHKLYDFVSIHGENKWEGEDYPLFCQTWTQFKGLAELLVSFSGEEHPSGSPGGSDPPRGFGASAGGTD